MHKGASVIVVLLSMGVSTLSWAQRTVRQDVSDTAGISIRELAAVALARNRSLQAAREGLRQAEARLTQARLRPNPSIDVSHTTDVMFANEGENGFAVT